jgi:hypothetical protein
MEIVLGVSMTPTAIRMVAVEGDQADGVTVDHDVFDVDAADGAAKSDATDHVVAALVGTRQSALAAGHQLLSTGITCSDHSDGVALHRALTAQGFDDVTIVSEEVAAAALAQAAGRAIGDERTALVLIGRDNATLSVVQTDDGAVVNVRSRSLRNVQAAVALADLVDGVDAEAPSPGSLFLIAPDLDVAALIATLGAATSLPISAPAHSGLALARGAALASTHPSAEMLTMGLAYSLDSDGPVRPDDAEVAPRKRKPLLLVGSALSVFVLGVAALVISVAVSVRLTSHQLAGPVQAAAPPSVTGPQNPAPAAPKSAPVTIPPPAAAVRPSPTTAPAPKPVAHQTVPTTHRPVVTKRPAPVPLTAAAPAAPAPAAPPPAPVADPPVAPVPAAPPPPQVPPILQRIFPFLRTPRYEEQSPYPDAPYPPYQQYPDQGGWPASPGYGGGPGYGGDGPGYPRY